MTVASQKLTFPGAQGDPLAARLDTPKGKPRAYALFAHCFTCTKDIFAASRIAAAHYGRIRVFFAIIGKYESGNFLNPSPESNFHIRSGKCTSHFSVFSTQVDPFGLLIFDSKLD